MDMQQEEKRQSVGSKRSEASADAIRTAAEELLIEKGYSGFSIEAVAKRARAGKPTIYRWWPSKAALLLEVYQKQKRVECPDTGDLEEDLNRFLRSLLDQWRETPTGNIFRSIIAEAQSNEDAAKALADYAAGRRVHAGLMVQRAIGRGEIRADVDPEVVADMLASYAWLHLLTGRLDEDPATTQKAVTYMVHGLKS